MLVKIMYPANGDYSTTSLIECRSMRRLFNSNRKETELVFRLENGELDSLFFHTRDKATVFVMEQGKTTDTIRIGDYPSDMSPE